MSIRDYIEEQNTKNITLKMEVKSFSDIGYWIRTIKSKIKDNKILKINIEIEVKYVENK